MTDRPEHGPTDARGANSGGTRVLPTEEFALELEGRLEALGEAPIEPESIAKLFGLTFGPSPRSRILGDVLRKALLRLTANHAHVHCRAYAESAYAEWIPTPPGEPADLSGWPIVRRTDVIERFDDFIADDRKLAIVSHTSGSTGPSLSVFRSADELLFIQRYYEALFDPRFETEATRPLVLSFPNFYHGASLPLPLPGMVFVSGVTDDTLIEDAKNVLMTEYEIPGHDRRISIVSGLAFQIVFFTNFLLEQGEDLSELGVRSLTLTGEYVSRMVRRVLSAAWSATVFDRYSLTEAVGGASGCLNCGHFHVDPHLFAEIVDPDTGEETSDVGSLLVSNLFPFVQMQPLIRYDTGDLVRRIDTSCTGNFTFDFLGKSKNCVSWRPHATSRREWLLFSVDLYEVLNEVPDVRQYEWFSNVRLAGDRSAGERQLYRVVTSQPAASRFSIQVEAELRYSPHMFPDRTDELRRSITARLLTASPNLARLVKKGAVDLQVRLLHPGSLPDEPTIKI